MPRAVGNLKVPTNYPDIDFNKINGSYDSIADMIAADRSSIDTGDMLQATGFYSKGDGGGGLFYWDATEDQANHNGVTVIDPSHSVTPGNSGWWASENAGAGCFKRPINSYINVKWSGAKGNGFTNDLSAIQAANDVLESGGGGVLHIPEGVYLYDGFLEVGDSIILKGDGIGVSILKCIDSNTNIDTGDNVGIGFKSGIDYAFIRDIEIDGNAPNNRGWGTGSANWGATEYEDINANGIWMTARNGRVQPNYVGIENVYIHDTVRSGLVGSCQKLLWGSNIIIENSDADHQLYIELSGDRRAILNNITVKGYCREEMATGAGLEINGLYVEDVTDNPTNYDTTLIFNDRGSTVPFNIRNFKIKNLDPDTIDDLCWVNGNLNIDNLHIEFDSSTSSPNKDVSVFVTRPETPDTINVNNINIEDAPSGLRLVNVTYTAKNIHMDNAVISFNSSGTPQANGLLFDIQSGASLTNCSYSGFNVSDGMGNIFRATPDGSNTAEDIIVKDSYFHTVQDQALVALTGTAENRTLVMDNVRFNKSRNNDIPNIKLINCKETSTGNLTEDEGVATFSGNGSDTNFDITNTLMDSPEMLFVTPNSSDANGDFHAIRGVTNLRVTYGSPPANGTDNIILSWKASVSKY